MTTTQTQYALHVINTNTGSPRTGSEWYGTYLWREWRCLPGRTAVQPFARRCVCPVASHRTGWYRPVGVWVCWLKKTTMSLRVSGNSHRHVSQCVLVISHTDSGELLSDAADPVLTQGLLWTSECDLSTPPAVLPTPLHVQHWNRTDTHVKTDHLIIDHLMITEGFQMFFSSFNVFIFKECTITSTSLLTYQHNSTVSFLMFPIPSHSAKHCYIFKYINCVSWCVLCDDRSISVSVYCVNRCF